MRGISFAVLLISNLTYWVIFAVAVAIVTFIGVIVVLLTSAETTQQTISMLKSSDIFDLLLRFLSYTMAAIGSGFVGARLNRDRPQFQAALASCSPTLLYLFDLCRVAIGHDDGSWSLATVSAFSTVYLFAGPFFALQGSYLAQWHQARIDAMSEQERAARTFGAITISGLRWALAFLTSIVTFAFSAELAYRLIHFGPYALAIGVTTAIFAGTFAAPPAHRKLAGFLFIALALLIPAEEIVRNILFGDIGNAHSILILVNTIAAGAAYVGLRKIFPQSFATHPGQWWWILDLDLNQWSPEERNVRRGLALSVSVIWIALFVLAYELPYGRGFILILRTVLALPIALMVARPVFDRIAPTLLYRADRNALARLENRYGRKNIQ